MLFFIRLQNTFWFIPNDFKLSVLENKIEILAFTFARSDTMCLIFIEVSEKFCVFWTFLSKEKTDENYSADY